MENILQVESAGVHDSTQYLSELSAKDKPWDKHRAQTDKIQALYLESGFDRYAERVAECSGQLLFAWDADMETGECVLKLRSARFCRVRNCPVCQWRRSLLWKARFLSRLPLLQRDYPKARFILLTLTVPNPQITELRSTLSDMSAAWNRMQRTSEMKKILGFVRTTEVTLGNSGADYCHPHYHALLMVQPSYFGKDYVTRDRWLEMWQKAYRDESITQVDVRAIGVKSTDGFDNQLIKALPEVLKYATKPGDFEKAGADWFGTYVQQVNRLRFLATGGALKNYLSEQYSESDMIHPEGEQPDGDGIKSVLVFGWKKIEKRYKKQATIEL